MGWSYKSERKREFIRALPSLVAHVIRYGMAVGAHNIVYVQTRLADSTMFAWYHKRQRPQYCLCSDVSGRLYRVRLTCPDGTVLQVRRAWQGTVLGIAVDLSALPYLLRLLPGPTPSGRPRSVVPSRSRPYRSGKSNEQRSDVSSVGEGGRSRTTVPPWPGLPVGDRIVVSACHYVSGLAQARAVAAPPTGPGFTGKRVHWGPRVYKPDTYVAS